LQFKLLSTREVARLLDINEKKVYRLITDQGLPATKVTGKWLFPEHLIRAWVENNTVNYPSQGTYLLRTPSLFVIAGSNDILLDRSLNLFMRMYPQYTAVFGNLGSMGGLKTLRQGLCHIAASHLAREDMQDFNFPQINQELESMPAVMNFCQREQGILLASGNPKKIRRLMDLQSDRVRLVNRQPGTGTRLWFDRKIKEAGMDPAGLNGYNNEVHRHLDAGLAVLSGRADAGPGIRAVAGLLNLDFLPMHWERFDLLIDRNRFFTQNIQDFLNMLLEPQFKEQAADLPGYDFSITGKMLSPK